MLSSRSEEALHGHQSRPQDLQVWLAMWGRGSFLDSSLDSFSCISWAIRWLVISSGEGSWAIEEDVFNAEAAKAQERLSGNSEPC